MGLRRIEVDSAHLSALRSFSERTKLASLLESDRRGEVEACLWRLHKAPEGRLIEGIQAEIHDAISSDGAAVINGLPVEQDALLLAGSAMIGIATSIGNGEGVFIHEVVPKPSLSQGDLSDTAQVFPLHTDSTFLDRPHEYVILACVRADAVGGESWILKVDELVQALKEGSGDDGLLPLQEVAFPYPHMEPDGAIHDVKLFPILEANGGATAIRWRDDAIERALGPGGRLDERHSEALTRLRGAIDASISVVSHRLKPGEVLVVDNRHCLHGRSQISEAAGKDRHLRRLKLFATAAGRP